MGKTAPQCVDSIISALESNPEMFAEIAHQTERLHGKPTVHDYTNVEMDQLTSGFIRMLLEAARNDEPKFRTLFMEYAMPALVLGGETAATLVMWNARFVVLFGSALAAAVPPEQREGALEWFAEFSGSYVGDVMRAALATNPTSESTAA